MAALNRMAVDLSAHPDLVVIYLGMRVEEPRGLETLQRLAPEIDLPRSKSGRTACCSTRS